MGWVVAVLSDTAVWAWWSLPGGLDVESGGHVETYFDVGYMHRRYVHRRSARGDVCTDIRQVIRDARIAPVDLAGIDPQLDRVARRLRMLCLRVSDAPCSSPPKYPGAPAEMIKSLLIAE